MDFRYLAQAQHISDTGCAKIQAALALFHQHKQAILDAGAHRGKKGKPIDNWHIPKLELLQSIIPSIRNCGALIQWSADVTEQAHITEIKMPSRATNNQCYEAQIVHHLDHAEKCHWFDLATSLQDPEDWKAAIQALEHVDQWF
jgi:hypothetical protein